MTILDGQTPMAAPGPAAPPEPHYDDPCGERGRARRRLRAGGEGAGDPGPPGLDVFLAGRVFMDMIFTGLPGLPPPGTELVTDGLGSAPGGIANIAVAMSRLGLRTGLATAIGDDMFGAYLWRTLSEQEGVDLSWSRRPVGWPTPVTVSMAYDSDRSMVTYARPMPPPADDLVAAPPRASTCFIDLDRPIPAWALTMRAEGSLVFADVGWDPTETWSTDVLDRLGEVDVFLPNAVEAMAYTRTRTPEAALDALSSRSPVVVVKQGSRGAIAVDSTTGERAAAPALPVEALDTTGAGDVFAAGFVFGTLAGWPLLQRLRFANLCAGLSVRHHSGSLGAPCWGEIATFGESAEVAPEILADYAFVVPYIPEAELDSGPDAVTRAQPTLR
ncbi:carbohydrate kinase family protein [Thermomonospora umbrina]|uniref:Sugar/nucleoside kinase (Ribokinase family) n=1 Tax=Thermomonospora umbrina TaxID=111806 RepID=A0A3D9T4A4_9ACTN|nr:carbohydrate kinase family protein [Thermomonospora umbrina]REE98651.1 sugar/nucleoside kinase (ribokinase family) [Thermomonospora umbrina]